MTTFNYKDFTINKAGYKLTKRNFSTSDWKEYKAWLKEQKDREKAEVKAKSKKKKKSKDKKCKVKEERITKKSYAKLLKDKRWEEKRLEVLKHYDFRCAVCGTANNLQVHHVNYIKGKKPWEYPISSLIVLCGTCHLDAHSDKSNDLYPKYN